MCMTTYQRTLWTSWPNGWTRQTWLTIQLQCILSIQNRNPRIFNFIHMVLIVFLWMEKKVLLWMKQKVKYVTWYTCNYLFFIVSLFVQAFVFGYLLSLCSSFYTDLRCTTSNRPSLHGIPIKQRPFRALSLKHVQSDNNLDMNLIHTTSFVSGQPLFHATNNSKDNATRRNTNNKMFTCTPVEEELFAMLTNNITDIVYR
jgi:hypothetical protein